MQLVFGLDPGADQGGRDERMKRKGEEEEERVASSLHMYGRFTTACRFLQINVPIIIHIFILILCLYQLTGIIA